MQALSGLGALRSALVAMTALTHLRLGSNGHVDFICALPQHMPQLLSLDLSRSSFQRGLADHGGAAALTASTLCRYPSLTSLNLGHLGTRYWDDGPYKAVLLAALTYLTNLRHLNLGPGTLRQGIAPLTPALLSLRQLEDLNVSGDYDPGASQREQPAPDPAVVLPFVSALAQLTTLTKLNLSSTRPFGITAEDTASVRPYRCGVLGHAGWMLMTTSLS